MTERGLNQVSYPLFAYAGLVPWTFFANAVTNSGNSLITNSTLITKVYFPRMIIPLAAVTSGLIDMLIAFVLLILMMFYWGSEFSLNLLMLPILTVLLSLLAAGIGLWMAALNVNYRDIRYALPFIIQLGIFASGIIVPIPENLHWLKIVNPAAALIEAFRSACFGQPFDWVSLGISSILTVIILFFAAVKFRKLEDSFADVI